MSQPYCLHVNTSALYCTPAECRHNGGNIWVSDEHNASVNVKDTIIVIPLKPLQVELGSRRARTHLASCMCYFEQSGTQPHWHSVSACCLSLCTPCVWLLFGPNTVQLQHRPLRHHYCSWCSQSLANLKCPETAGTHKNMMSHIEVESKRCPTSPGGAQCMHVPYCQLAPG
jgi:hypothetical protein